jgi:ATP-dependent DNA helicase RecG
VPSHATGRLQAKVRAALPYRPTGAQERAIAEITADMATEFRMNRLLQGDVGAGKTLVALMALLIAVEAGGQGVMMAPTEILARQHHANLAPLAATAGVRLDLLTGRDKGAGAGGEARRARAGRHRDLVGTHAVFQTASPSTTCGWPSSTSSTASAWRSGWRLAGRGGRSTCS